MTFATAPYAYRDQAALRRMLGLSIKAAADFTPAGCLAIIEALENISGKFGEAKDLLTAERRGYCALFSTPKIVPFPKLKPIERNPRQASEAVLEFRAKRAFGG